MDSNEWIERFKEREINWGILGSGGDLRLHYLPEFDLIYATAFHNQANVLMDHEDVDGIIAALRQYKKDFPQKDVQKYNKSMMESFQTEKPKPEFPIRPKPTRNGFVYLGQVLETPRFKIGMSKHPPTREKVLNGSQNPYEIVVIHSIAVEQMKVAENYLHQKYDDFRVWRKDKKTEYFDLPAWAVDEIMEMQSVPA